MARIRSVCFMLSLQMYNAYPFSIYSLKLSATISKFLRKIGCADVSKVIVASGVPVGLLPNSIRRKSNARSVNSLPSISLPSKVIQPLSSASRAAIACGVSVSSCTVWMRSRNQSKSRIASTVSADRKSRNETMPLAPPCSRLRLKSGTITMLSFFSLESCVSTSNVRILSTSSPKKSIRYGNSEEKENTSIMLPRTAYCPGSYT